MDKRKFIKQISSYFAAASFPGFLVSCAGNKTKNNIFKIGLCYLTQELMLGWDSILKMDLC